MKGKLISKTGQEIKDIEFPKWFSGPVREDICQKYFEASKITQPYGTDPLAGRRKSASGNLSHARRKWKTTYGHGISRVPRKIMWRRGNQFYWIGATISSARGGRRAHAPRPEHFMTEKKINKKEKEIAMKSALISTTKDEWLKRRYNTLKGKKISVKLPIVLEKDALKLKTKGFIRLVQKALKELSEIAIKQKSLRAGKSKARRGKYKKTRGILVITGKNENLMAGGVDIRKVNELSILDLFPLGRLAAYTEEAVKELNNIGGKNV